VQARLAPLLVFWLTTTIEKKQKKRKEKKDQNNKTKNYYKIEGKSKRNIHTNKNTSTKK
jgi:hypothetical protein